MLAASSSLARQALCTLRVAARARVISRPTEGVPSVRALHVSSPVMKRKKTEELDDLFAEEFEIVDDTISASPSTASAASSTPITSETQSTTGRTKRHMTPEERTFKLQGMLHFMKPRLGRNPAVKMPLIKHSIWIQALQMAQSKEDLEQIVELMPRWKESVNVGKNVFDSVFSERFVRRCQELNTPQTALAVFGNFGKYNLTLTQHGARQLLHSLHRNHPIQDLLTASALFNIYGLPPVNTDYVSCSIIVSACLRESVEKSEHSQHAGVVADALFPALRQLKQTVRIDKSDLYNRENAWVLAAVKEINSTLEKKGEKRLGRVKPLKPAAVDGAAKDATV